jgi:hypothetical protein
MKLAWWYVVLTSMTKCVYQVSFIVKILTVMFMGFGRLCIHWCGLLQKAMWCFHNSQVRSQLANS